MKLTKLEQITLCLAMVALAFLSGWFLSRQNQAGKIFVPAPVTPTQQASAPIPSGEEDAPAALVNLNTATAEELTALPGIGERRAEDIVAYREANGPFPVTESLTDVPGIGPSILEKCGNLITVED